MHRTDPELFIETDRRERELERRAVEGDWRAQAALSREKRRRTATKDLLPHQQSCVHLREAIGETLDLVLKGAKSDMEQAEDYSMEDEVGSPLEQMIDVANHWAAIAKQFGGREGKALLRRLNTLSRDFMEYL